MLSKREIKDIQSLSHKKFRTGLNLFVAEGPKIVSELVHQVPDHVERIYATREWVRTHPEDLSSRVTEIGEEDLVRISQLQTPNEVVAVLRQFGSVPPPADVTALYLDTIQDPGNFGTILRTADWFGVRHVVCSPGCADLYNLKVVQATMASIARVQVYYDEEENWLPRREAPILAAVLKGESVYTLKSLPRFTLLIGNESKGLREEILSIATRRITIPGRGGAESLNAAVATGILLSHLLS